MPASPLQHTAPASSQGYGTQQHCTVRCQHRPKGARRPAWRPQQHRGCTKPHRPPPPGRPSLAAVDVLQILLSRRCCWNRGTGGAATGTAASGVRTSPNSDTDDSSASSFCRNQITSAQGGGYWQRILFLKLHLRRDRRQRNLAVTHTQTLLLLRAAWGFGSSTEHTLGASRSAGPVPLFPGAVSRLEEAAGGFSRSLQPCRVGGPTSAVGCAGIVQPAPREPVSVSLGKYQGWGFLGVVFQPDE